MKKKMMIILATGLCLVSQAVSVYGADYEYDDLGRVTKVVYEDGSSVTYTYDANGNIVEVLTGTEWEDEEESGTGDSGSGMASGGGQEGSKALGDKNQSEEADEGESQSGGQGGNGSKEAEKEEGNQQEDGGESIEEKEGKAAKEKERSRIENVIAGIIAALGIAALILIRKLKNGNWTMAGAGRKKQDGEKEKDGKNTKENRGDGEAE